MCGILGIVGRGARPLPTGQAVRALDCIGHRGPDDEGYLLYDAARRAAVSLAGKDTAPSLALAPYEAEGTRPFDVLLAHRRLSILDVSPAGHQPMPTPDARYWITFNGEIYNYVELRRELIALGHAFHTGSDTEVLLAAYAQWKHEMLPRLTGMFALAILDTSDGTVLLARDAFGIKPLYWTRVEGRVAFASEIRPLRALQSDQGKAEASALYRFMRFGITDNGDTTMFEGIRQLPAAHFMVLGLDGQEVAAARPYWMPGAVRRRKISLDDAARELRHLFDASIRLHLRSDVPLGACLSGGLDSTIIVAAMREQLGADAPIHAFSYINEDPVRGEGRYVDIAVRAFSLDQHSVTPTAADLVRDLGALVRLQEQPFDTTSIYAQFSVFRLARQHGITVMLDGQGSDELFGGYATAISAQLASAMRTGNAAGIHSLVTSQHMSGNALRLRVTLSSLARLLPLPLVSPFMTLVGEPLYPAWLNARWFRSQGVEAAPRQQGRGRDALHEELRHFLTDLSLPRLLRYEDRNSMAFAIESRVPYCTTALADFAASLPPSHLVGYDGETKAVLRRAYAEVIPRDILHRPKVGFETPEREWLASLRPWIAGVVTSEEFRSLPFITHAAADEIIQRQLGQMHSLQPIAWRLLCVAAWAREFNVRFGEG